MDWISKLERRFGSWAIPNLSVYLIAVQLIGLVMLLTYRATYEDLLLYGSGVVDQGQWWRLLSFMMLPKTTSPFWLFFAFYVFYLIGNSLEQHWGTFRFNLFILCGYLLTILMAFISPGSIITNTYFLGCIFLAFATLFPNIEFRLFFVLPVKVKWLGWLTTVMYALILFTPSHGNPVLVGNKLGVVAAFANYLLFFGKYFFIGLKANAHRKAFESNRASVETLPLHQCAECGVTDKSNTSIHFRYCSTCGKCFCEQHLGSHEH